MLSLDESFGMMEMFRDTRKLTTWPREAHPRLLPPRRPLQGALLRPHPRAAPPRAILKLGLDTAWFPLSVSLRGFLSQKISFLWFYDDHTAIIT